MLSISDEELESLSVDDLLRLVDRVGAVITEADVDNPARLRAALIAEALIV